MHAQAEHIAQLKPYKNTVLHASYLAIYLNGQLQYTNVASYTIKA